MSNAVQMVRFPRLPHVQYAIVQNARDQLIIHAECSVCGEPFDWVCERGIKYAEWRVASFANWHTHGVIPKVAFPSMPR